jgi:FkbM family methyltransferase
MKFSAYHRFLQTLLMRVRPAPLAAFLKRLLGVKRVVIETSQGHFFVDPVSVLAQTLVKEGCYEDGMANTLKQYLHPGSTFVDLGANEGYFTVIGARHCGPQGKVVAIEPQLRLLPVIEKNLELNAIQGVQVVNAAITDKEGEGTFFLAASTNTGSSGLHRSAKYALPSQSVQLLRLEQVLDGAGLQSVDLMKVDIEGFEYEALLGSPKVFEQRRVRYLALELHPEVLAERHKDASDITRMLEAAGYRLETSHGNTVWVAP